MKLKEVVNLISGDILVKCHELDYEVKSACGADLMSDVMAFSKDNAVLITGLVNVQTIRTSEMMDIKIIVFVRGKIPSYAMLELAEELGITIIRTRELMFQTCGLLYSNGLKGGTNIDVPHI